MYMLRPLPVGKLFGKKIKGTNGKGRMREQIFSIANIYSSTLAKSLEKKDLVTKIINSLN